MSKSNSGNAVPLTAKARIEFNRHSHNVDGGEISYKQLNLSNTSTLALTSMKVALEDSSLVVLSLHILHELHGVVKLLQLK